ncbi:transcription activator of gluconeogenesis [Lasiosphaeria miniovina]|uniref:Transcription activator of gluconeogenesis n=1 Tax=Lasiosphaeria miniovina TaxID=1954250 RepID=A0AA40DN10_9PEZI|nr:transcription activator of gluconeogenesis [Lasiosphaeria miniovina]KAK0709729.1 transcription activator of gluconeogenesis [Lasiosphaeria miniovina]
MPEDSTAAEADVSAAMSDSDNEYDDLEAPIKDEDDRMVDQNTSPDGVDPNGEPKKKYDPKDPNRPRRKKARRACFACQRAHLTCGDERPCQRCIKRGLADACQDGVRKKAKYLHDAPAEALRPVLGPSYNPTPVTTRSNGNRHTSNSGSEASSTVGTFFSQSNASSFPVYSTSQAPMTTLPESMAFGSQQSPVSPSFPTPGNPQIGGMSVPQVSSPMPNFTAALFDPSNPALFNFNLEGLNFGSQYGAMEFGMLGHMSSGAAETPPRDPLAQQGGDVNFGSAGVFGNGMNQFDKVYEGGIIGDFLGLDTSANGLYSQGNLQHGLPHAYAIAAGPTSLQSPSTENNSPQPTNFGFESSPTMPNYSPAPGTAAQTVTQQRPRPKTSASLAKLGAQSHLGRRQRDPSYIYEMVKEPFPYVGSFHKLITLLQNRFSAGSTLRIAKALSSVRLAFMSCTRTLNRQDLVFMEKTFQRALFEYDEFMHQTPGPTIACRRSGEVVGVNKEFTALSGWTKDVLLGKEPNLNVNLGTINSSSSSSTARGKAGLTTPLLKSMNEQTAAKTAEGQLQPVFIAEIMDEESVIGFFEDFAQLAFNDSRGRVMRKCRLLKYRPPGTTEGGVQEESPPKDSRNTSSILSNRVAKIDGEHGISKLERDGKLECCYTWSIKRDTFDIPMLIVMNFLPCFYLNHNQLAV